MLFFGVLLDDLYFCSYILFGDLKLAGKFCTEEDNVRNEEDPR
jgi:hypothetical protein